MYTNLTTDDQWSSHDLNDKKIDDYDWLWFMVLNATFNNISVFISTKSLNNTGEWRWKLTSVNHYYLPL
jgi:hypothetical protein